MNSDSTPLTKIPVSTYILVTILIITSGSPIIDWRAQYVILAILLYPRTHLSRKDKYFLYFMGLSLFLFVAQYITFGWNSVPAIINLCAKIFIACAVVKITGIKFRDAYLNVMTFLCAVCIVLFTVYAITGFALDFFPSSLYKSCILWGAIRNPKGDGLRNDGFVWEPGAFAGYILSVLILYFDKLDELKKFHLKKIWILLIALITTFSTQGYIVLSFLIICYFFRFIKNKRTLILIIPILAIVFSFMLTLDFMGAKVSEQVEDTETMDVFDQKIDHGRFSSMIFDLYYIGKHPIIGNGLHRNTRYSDHLYLSDEGLSGFGNGFTGMIGSMGIFFMLYYLGMFFRSKLSNKDAFVIVLSIVLLLNGEGYLNYPLFYCIPFFFIYNYPKKTYKNIIKDEKDAC